MEEWSDAKQREVIETADAATSALPAPARQKTPRRMPYSRSCRLLSRRHATKRTKACLCACAWRLCMYVLPNIAQIELVAAKALPCCIYIK